ncbi:hypothetical protein ACHWQZ_G012679 [Mnemiopsis leidyi]
MNTFNSSTFPSEILSTVPTRQTFFSVDSSSPLPSLPFTSQQHPGPSASPSSPRHDNSFRQYATKLGYPDTLITRALNDLGADSENEELLAHLINLQDMLCPKDSTVRRRRDATDLPSYMLAQDCFYKGKERMPFWVWVKRETIGVNITENPPHKRTATRSRSSSSTASVHSATSFTFNPTS